MQPLATIVALATQGAHGAVASHDRYNLFQDLSFWTLLAFLVVMGLFWRLGAHKAITGALDKRQNRIADELNQARSFREEAQEILAQYQRRQREVEEEAQSIITQAKRDAQRLREEAREKINEQIERRTKAAADKITRAEAQAIAEVRNQAANLAIAAAKNVIRERMDSGAQTALIDKSIAGIRSKLN